MLLFHCTIFMDSFSGVIPSGLSNTHSTPSSQNLPSSDGAQLLYSPPQIQFSINSPQRGESRESRESDWVDESVESSPPRKLPPPGTYSGSHLSNVKLHPHKNPRFLGKPSSARPRNSRRKPVNGNHDLESGHSERVRSNGNAHISSRESYKSAAGFQAGGRTRPLCELCSLVMLGMIVVLVCMVSAFLGIYFGETAKGRLMN